MRIMIDLTSLADNFSGIERFAANIAYYMVRQRNDDYILLFKEQVHPMFEEVVRLPNVTIIILPKCNKLIFNQIRLPLAIHKINADQYLFLAFPVPIFSFKENMISTIHDICCWDCPETMNGMSGLYFRLSHRIATLKCERIITISKFSKKRIVEKLKYPREKILLVYCGIDDKFLNYNSSGDQNDWIRKKYSLPEEYILSLSTLEPRKNLRLLIEAYAELVLKSDFSIPLVLAGRKGWKIDELLSNIAEEVHEQIIFTGFIDDEDLPMVYGNAKLFIFPSLYEGFGMPPLEAMACGVPVISSDAASLPEVLGDAAYLFPSGNKERLKDMILYVLSLERLNRNKRCEIGYEHAQKYKWNKEAEKLKKILTELCEN